MEDNNILSPEAAEDARKEIADRYKDTSSGEIVASNKTAELEQFNSFLTRYSQVSESEGGQVFSYAWDLRDEALVQARRLTGDQGSGLGSQTVAQVKEIYLQQLDRLLQEYPAHRSLIYKFKREWD